MINLPPEVLGVIAIALVYDYVNGVQDSANVVATVISSRAMPPRSALAMAAGAEFIGPLVFGVAIASTIGDRVLASAAMTLEVIAASLLAATVWNAFTWFFGLPSSSSHALIGGIVGAGAAGYGLGAVQPSGLAIVLVALFVSPPLGLMAGFLLTRIILRVGQYLTPQANVWLKRGQWLTAFTLALSHGTNDAQKTMGMIAAALVAGRVLDTFSVPTWVILVSAAAISLGTLTGGYRLIRTLGAKFYKIRPIHGFTSQAASTGVILGAALLGGPVSTTQVVSSTILGAGSAERLSKVRWGVARNIVYAWLLTIPAAAVLGALFYTLFTGLRS
ncbi:MAG: inorganic phosphate transporter [Anaerolineae bacterium]|nr:inorganic phosphate transporter [Anaerolineae bacterium]